MPKFNKWLTNAEADDPVARVARRAIRVRLAAVVYFLERVAKANHQAEAIHQLRVWTRRSAAALKLFDTLVPKGPGKKLKKRLRRLRAAAGQVRDCDVLLTRLNEAGGNPPRTILRVLQARRKQARRELNSLQQRLLRRRRLKRTAEKLVRKLDWPKRHSSRRSPPFGAWCRMKLAPLGEKFFASVDTDLADDASLHELRIAGKRLRYALELAPAALPARLHRRLCEALSDLQDRLGTVCDHLSAVTRLQEWRADAGSRADRGALSRAIQNEKRQLVARRKQFRRWWSSSRRKRLRADWDQAIQREQ